MLAICFAGEVHGGAKLVHRGIPHYGILLRCFLRFFLDFCPPSTCCSLSDRNAFLRAQLSSSGSSPQLTKVDSVRVLLSFFSHLH